MQDLDFMRLVTFGAFEGLVTDLLVQNGYPLDHIINLGDTHSPPVETIVDRMIGQMPTEARARGRLRQHPHSPGRDDARLLREHRPTLDRGGIIGSCRARRGRPNRGRLVHDYLFSSEIVRFAFVFGICVSMMLYERVHLTTGSIVVPGYIAVFLVYPMVVVATFVNALLSYAIMNHFLRKHFMLYGKTKFTLMALISILIQTIMLKVSPSGPWLWESNIPLFVGAGYVVPALIAHDMGRQGIKRTTKAVLLAGVIVAVADRPGAAVAPEGRQRPGTTGRLRHDVDRQPVDPRGGAAVGGGVVGCRPELQPQVRRLRRRRVYRHVHGRPVSGRWWHSRSPCSRSCSFATG